MLRPPRLADVEVDSSKFECAMGPMPAEQSVGATGMIQVRVRDDELRRDVRERRR